MSRRLHPACAFLLSLAFIALPIAPTGPQAAGAPPTQAASDLVPVNVHVVDRSGKAVTDLQQADFTVLEGGVPQPVRSFAAQSSAAVPSPPGGAPVLRRGPQWSSQGGRLFVLALGLGSLEETSQYISALVGFVKTRLQPQDQVALFAYDRAIPFTNDRQRIAEALERVRKSHEDVAFSLGQQLGDTGMAPLYGQRVLPKKLQSKIDEMVLGPGAKPASPVSADVIGLEAFSGLSLDDFMASCATTLQDQGNLMALAEYLRRFDGEKHVVFVTEHGFPAPSDDNDRALAAVANDARTSIHTLRAGGVLAGEVGKELNATVMQARSLRSLRTISDLTGGMALLDEKGPAAVDRLAGATGAGYVIGYQPSNAAWSGEYRTIEVRVNRPDVTVLHRHGYYRADGASGFSRRAFVANDRVSQAGNFRRAVNDIKVKASASQRGGTALIVEGKIDLSKVTVTTVDGMRVGLLKVAVFCFDSGTNPMGADTQDLALKLTEEEYARALKGGLAYKLEFPLIRSTQNIRFVVYDFGSDLVGRTDVNIL
jgi:VWFA-related protein